MDFKRSVLLAAGVALAASMIANATSPESNQPGEKVVPASSDALSTASARTENDQDSSKQLDTTSVSIEQAKTASPESPSPDEPAATGNAAQGSLHPLDMNQMPVLPAAKQLSGSAIVAGDGVSPTLSGSAVSSGLPGSTNRGDDRSGGDNPHTILTATGLGAIDTIFGYCAQVDPRDSYVYQSGIAMITRGHDSSEVAAVRMSPDYKNAQMQTKTLLAKVPLASGLSACRSFSAPRRDLGVSTPIRGKMDSSK